MKEEGVDEDVEERRRDTDDDVSFVVCWKGLLEVAGA